jgi:GDP-4-dehydro-6-deoxy-D-mannose reductase
LTVLITGAGGMMGSHLAEALLGSEEDVLATYLHPTINMQTVDTAVQFRELDVRDLDAVRDLIAAHRPTEIYHLAAQSLPTVSWTDPWRTVRVNIEGTINIFEAIKDVRESDPSYDPMTVIACSSAEYGASLTPDRVPITEDAPLLPLHPYGVSKVGQDLLGHQYFYNHGLRCIRARIFNCTGPRKRNDVASDFAKGIVHALNEGGSLRHGNLETSRAIIDVRDMVAALIALARKGQAGEAYNICADKAYRIAEILDMYFEVVGRRVPCEVDPALLRPSDEPVIFGDTTKIRQDTDWAPVYELRQTLSDMIKFEEEQYEAHAG